MTFRLLRLQSYPIYEQLLLEEALLATETGNWCLINQGTPPAIVMGISAKKEELIAADKVLNDPIPLIRRFSGGGTVVVDENTLFVTFICEKTLHDFPPYPEPIMRWAEALYKAAFPKQGLFLRENDFVIGEKKIGGNAQYIKKHKWLHHTSFLWDYDEKKMDYLLHPKKTPPYRQGRTHADFLCRLKNYFDGRDQWIEGLIETLKKQYLIEECKLEEVLEKLPKEIRQSTTLLNLSQ